MAGYLDGCGRVGPGQLEPELEVRRLHDGGAWLRLIVYAPLLEGASVYGVLLVAARSSCRAPDGQDSPEATAQRLGLDRPAAGWNLPAEEDTAPSHRYLPG